LPTVAARRDSAASYPAATFRALLLAVVLALFIAAWNKQAELVTLTSQITESTPAIAAVMALFVVLGIGGLLNHFVARNSASGAAPRLTAWARRLVFTRGETLVVFYFLAIVCSMPGVGFFRTFMPCLSVTQYFGMPSNHLQEMARDIPRQWAPNDPEVMRVFWEGGDRTVPSLGVEHVPLVGPALEGAFHFLAAPTIIDWRHWLVPFLVWSFYLSVYFVTAFCLITLFRRHWEEDERLSFPVASLAVEMIRPEGSLLSGHSFFRDPVVWTGFSLAVLYNFTNALKVFNPSVPALGISYHLGQFFTESPWNTMSGFQIFYKPEILGLGYLVPMDVLFSIWFFTVAMWVVRPFAKIAGYEPSGFPFMTNQGMGAFVLLGLYFLWSARVRLAEVVRTTLGGGAAVDDRDEPLSYRFSLITTALGLIVIFGMPIAFGVMPWAAVLYFGIMMLVLIVYCHNRAEMGFPVVWGYPLYKERETMINFLGSQAFIAGGETKSMTLLTMFSWLQRTVNQAITSTGVEGYVAAHKLGESRRVLAKVIIAALVFGLVLAFLVNLSAYYEYGGLVLSSAGGNEGGQMTEEVLGQFTPISQWLDRPEAPDRLKMGYTILGSVLALGLIVGRRAWVRFPFHPGGYALALCHEGPYMWFPAFLIWLVKWSTLHLGGVKAYRRVAPGFLAFTLGHFFSVGVWSLIGLYAGEFVRRYTVWFL
jgi:hypothetical protein